MKRSIVTLVSILAFCGVAAAKPSPIYENPNYGVRTNWPTIDSVVFYNRGIFTNLDVHTLIPPFYPFETSNTRYFTNENWMSGTLGWRFENVGYSGSRPAAIFYNRGTIRAEDKSSVYFGVAGTTLLDYGTPASAASYIEVIATNIVNSGNLLVGDVGLLQLRGKNVDLTRGSLVAGHISNDNCTNVFYYDGFNYRSDNPGRGISQFDRYVNPLGIDDFYWSAGYDLFWNRDFNILANLTHTDTNGVPQPITPRSTVEELGGHTALVQLPVSDNALFRPIVYRQDYFFSTNNTNSGYVFYDVIFVKTNQPGSSLNIDVRISDAESDLFWWNRFGLGANVIQFSLTNTDVATKQPATNLLYFIDQIGFATNFIQTNMHAPRVPMSVFSYKARPGGFELTTTTPIEWNYATNWTNIWVEYPYTSDVFSQLTNGLYSSIFDYYYFGETRNYAATVFRNPETLNGLTWYPRTNDVLNNPYFAFPDPTNEPARVEVSADRLDLTQCRIRAEGMLNLNAKHIVGSPQAVDAGIINGLLGSTNGTLVISNILPSTFNRIRGSIYAWSTDWEDLVPTEVGVDTNGLPIIDYKWYIYHVLVLDHDLRSSFEPTTRDITLRASNSIVLQDNLRVIDKCLIDTKNLTINSKVSLAEDVRRLEASQIPKLRNLLIDTNGSLLVQNEAFLGWDTASGLLGVTNRGLISAVAPLIKTRRFENSGLIIATNGGSISIQASNVVLTTNRPCNEFPGVNQLIADNGVSICADVLELNSSTIIAGQQRGKLTLDVRTQISDVSVNVDGANNNYWETSDGIEVRRKPRFGDLLGTCIRTVATNFYQTKHIWAGEDRGATVDGFIDNLAIGKLILDRQTIDSSMRFEPATAGKTNAMYVDYLQLDNFCESDYRNGLDFDPNFTIYFADTSADPVKLETSFPGHFVWVRDFAGPNSSVSVPLADGGFAPMNRALAASPEIDSDGDGIANCNDPYPLDGINSKAGGTILRTSVWNSWPNPPRSLTIAISGKGKVTPAVTSAQLAPGRSYTLTATPDTGYLFAGWCGSINRRDNQITFTYTSNMLVQAIFIPTPFPALKGTYNGLFYCKTNESFEEGDNYSAQGIEMRSSGFFTFTLNKNGAFSGKVRMGTNAYPFASAFTTEGWMSNYTARCVFRGPGGANLGITLLLGAGTNTMDLVWGSVSGPGWKSVLVGDRVVFSSSNTAPYAGKYTFVLPGNSAEADICPGGDGYATVTVRKDGIIVANGRLSDTVRFTQSVPITKSGLWPCYIPLYRGSGALLSWIRLESAMGGPLSWIKSRTNVGLYRAGFTNEVEVIGSGYSENASGFGLSFTNGTLIMNGGNLEEEVRIEMGSNPRAYSFTNGANYLKLDRLSGANGFFTGRAVINGKTNVLEGVVLQHEDEARGFFVGTNESGSVLLQSNGNTGE